MKHLEAIIEINAPPKAVWEVLVDFSSYAEWNPFIISMQGQVGVGEMLQETIRQPDGKIVPLKSRILTVEPMQKLEWEGYFGAPFLFSGRHSLILEASPGGTRFIQKEIFTGLALFLMDVDAILPGYHQMNQTLKARVERTS